MSVMACIGWFALGIFVGQILLILIATILKESREDGKEGKQSNNNQHKSN